MFTIEQVMSKQKFVRDRVPVKFCVRPRTAPSVVNHSVQLYGIFA